MPDKFDPYREALIMETNTIWSEVHEDLDEGQRQRIQEALHAEPEKVANLEYIRTHSGFCRQITVTDEDVERIGE